MVDEGIMEGQCPETAWRGGDAAGKPCCPERSVSTADQRFGPQRALSGLQPDHSVITAKGRQCSALDECCLDGHPSLSGADAREAKGRDVHRARAGRRAQQAPEVGKRDG